MFGLKTPGPGEPSNNRKDHDRPLSAFFLLVIMLSLPLLTIGALTRGQLLPGLPWGGALMAFCPAAAALVLMWRRNGAAGAVALLKRSVDFKRIKASAWYLPILLLVPAAMALSYGVMRILGRSVPGLHVTPLATAAMILGFFVGGLGEELGWSGYAIDPMQQRWGALRASLLLGAIWAAWHFIPLFQANRAPSWVAGWCLATLALRILHTWLYNNTGKSVFGQALFHAVSNLSWQLFPEAGSHYDPRVTGPILAIIAALATVIWGPRTLTRVPERRRPGLLAS
jgi:membrane protease YdiL (CAAX protease family)